MENQKKNIFALYDCNCAHRLDIFYLKFLVSTECNSVKLIFLSH